MSWLSLVSPDSVTVALRALVYIASLASAGGALFWISFGRASEKIAWALRRQLLAGLILAVVVEVARYANFQLMIAGGDAALAFGEDMRAVYADTPGAAAAAMRLVGVCVVAATVFRSRGLAAVGIALVVAGYLVEGHTAASDQRPILAALVGVHLLVAHWWFGGLMPLYQLMRSGDAALMHATAERFGRIAIVLVPVLLAVGGIALAMLVGWQLDPNAPYQQRFAIKLGAVALVLAIAAINKLALTPMLARAPEAGARAFRRSIALEIVVAVGVLIATAWAVLLAPVGGH